MKQKDLMELCQQLSIVLNEANRLTPELSKLQLKLERFIQRTEMLFERATDELNKEAEDDTGGIKRLL